MFNDNSQAFGTVPKLFTASPKRETPAPGQPQLRLAVSDQEPAQRDDPAAVIPPEDRPPYYGAEPPDWSPFNGRATFTRTDLEQVFQMAYRFGRDYAMATEAFLKRMGH